MRGSPGLGKSTLASRLMERARRSGMRVLQAAGIPQESRMPFWTLHQLLYSLLRDPFARDLAEAGLVDSLSAAMGSSTVPSADRVRLCRSVLEFFADVSSRTPLLLVIDDAEWMDESTRDLLCFALNRLVGDDVALVLVYNRSVPAQLRTSRLIEVAVKPVAPEDARRILLSEHPRLPPYVVDRLIEEADGNRLALREYPDALTQGQREGRELLPPVLPLPPALLDLYKETLVTLPPAVRRELVLGAVSGAASGVTDTGLGAWNPASDILDTLEELDLVVFRSGSGVHLANRIVRNAIYCLTPPAEVRAAHIELAERYARDPVRRAIHAGAAAAEPDDDLAAELEGVARLMSAQGRYGLGLSLLVHAAALSPVPTARSDRLTAAAKVAASSGLDVVAHTLLDQAAAASSMPGQSVAHALLQSRMKMRHDGDYVGAARLLGQAMTQPSKDVDVNDSIQLAVRMGVIMSDSAYWGTVSRQASAHESKFSPATHLVVLTSAPTDHVALSRPIADIVRDAQLQHEPVWTPEEIVQFGLSAWAGDCLADYRSLLWETAERATASGDLIPGLEVQLLMAAEAFQSGLWEKSEELASRGHAIAVNCGAGTLVNDFRHIRAMLAAARGDVEASDSLSDAVEAWGTPRRSGHHRMIAIEARLLNRLSQGDSEGAWSCATRLLDHGRLPAWPLYGSRMILDVVEAHARTGHLDEAITLATRAREHTTSNHPLRLQFLVAAASALASTERDAEAYFQQALEMDGTDRWPFEQARVEYLYGQWLRRHFSNVEARKHLTRARDQFDILGADPWSRRVSNELRAAGLRLGVGSRPADILGIDLTPQESEVAALAAAGLSNKDIAARLFISPRTVSGHLYRIFPKLNVVSRAGLRDALATRDAQVTAEAGVPRPNKVI